MRSSLASLPAGGVPRRASQCWEELNRRPVAVGRPEEGAGLRGLRRRECLADPAVAPVPAGKVAERAPGAVQKWSLALLA